MDIQAVEREVQASMFTTSESVTSGLVTSTVDRLHTGRIGMTPVIEADYHMQKTILSSAYAEQGIGTKLDTVA